MSSPQENRSNDLRGADDVQARETRRRLVEAYRQAAAERLARPSATWLCARSGVARSTFYTHFATVDDLAAFTLTEVLANLAADDVAQRTEHLRERRAISRAGLTRVVESFEQARDILGYAVGVGSRANVVEGLVAQIAGYNRDTVATEYGHLDDARLDLIAEFVSAGTVHTLLRWMDGPGGVGREELVELLVDLLPAP